MGRKRLGGLAGLVLGVTALNGCSKQEDARKKEDYASRPAVMQQESYPTTQTTESMPETQESEEWGTIMQFDGFTFYSEEKLTREEVQERLRLTPPCNHDEDTNYLNHRLPAPYRRERVNEGIYKGNFVGLNHLYFPDITVITVIESKDLNRIDEAERLLQVKRYEDGKDEIVHQRGIEYNREQITELIKSYPIIIRPK